MLLSNLDSDQQLGFLESPDDTMRTRQDTISSNNKNTQQQVQSADWKLDVNFEFTAKAKPQKNSKVESGFTALSAHMRAVMNGANVPLR